MLSNDEKKCEMNDSETLHDFTKGLKWLRHERSVQLDNGVRCLASVRGRVLLASRDGCVQIRDMKTGDLRGRLRARHRENNVPIKFFVNAFAFDGGTRLWIGSSDGTLRAYDLARRMFVVETRSGHGGVRCMRLVNGRLWVAWDTGGITQRDVNGVVISRLSAASVVGVADMIAVGREMWVAAADGVRIWDQTGPFRTRLVGHEAHVTCLCEVGKRVWSGCSSGRICVWDIRSRNLERMLLAHANSVLRIVLVAGEVWSVCHAGVLRVWDAITAESRLAIKRQDRIADLIATPAHLSDPEGDIVWIAFRSPPSLGCYRVSPSRRRYNSFQSPAITSTKQTSTKLSAHSLIADMQDISDTLQNAETMSTASVGESATSTACCQKDTQQQRQQQRQRQRQQQQLEHEKINVTMDVKNCALREINSSLTDELTKEKTRTNSLSLKLKEERKKYDEWKNKFAGLEIEVRERARQLGVLVSETTEQVAPAEVKAVAHDWAQTLADNICEQQSVSSELLFLQTMRDHIAELDNGTQEMKTSAERIRTQLSASSSRNCSESNNNKTMKLLQIQMVNDKNEWAAREAVWNSKVMNLENLLSSTSEERNVLHINNSKQKHDCDDKKKSVQQTQRNCEENSSMRDSEELKLKSWKPPKCQELT